MVENVFLGKLVIYTNWIRNANAGKLTSDNGPTMQVI